MPVIGGVRMLQYLLDQNRQQRIVRIDDQRLAGALQKRDDQLLPITDVGFQTFVGHTQSNHLEFCWAAHAGQRLERVDE